MVGRSSELDASAAYPTQFWGSGYVGFGRKSWPGGTTKWPSGLWLENLRLEMIQQAAVRTGGGMMELVDDHDIEGVWFEVVQIKLG